MIPAHISEGDAEVRHPDGWLICTTPSDDLATFIVRAVNERDELIAALELCAGAIEPLRFKAVVSENCTIKFTGKYTHLGQHRLSEILDRANAILEKAKAQ